MRTLRTLGLVTILVLVSVVGVGAQESTSSKAPGTWASSINLQNPTATDATVVITFYDSGGNVALDFNVTPDIPAGGSRYVPGTPAGLIGNRVDPVPAGRSLTPIGQGGNPARSGLSSAMRPRMINARLFEMQYDVGSVGPSGPPPIYESVSVSFYWALSWPRAGPGSPRWPRFLTFAAFEPYFSRERIGATP